MDIELLHPHTQTIAQIRLEPGESVVAESGAMLGMTEGLSIETISGGAGSALKRIFGGESFFRNRFVASRPAELLLAPSLRGDLGVLDVGTTQWIVQRGAYVASAPSVDVATRPSIRGLFSGMGVFLLETKGVGPMLVSSFGVLEPIDLDGELIVDTGHLVAWDARLEHTVTKASRGWIGSFMSGEGFVVRFRGRGRIYTQTRNPSEYGHRVGRMLPPRQS
jgi:uncharacterized protein (TIGR00266 family)